MLQIQNKKPNFCHALSKVTPAIHAKLQTYTVKARWALGIVGLSGLLVGCASIKKTAHTPGQSEQTLATTYSEPVTGSYLISLPEKYDEDKKAWPLILFLHGAGERGNNLDLVKTHGPPKQVEAGRDLPFIVVSPQISEGEWWDSIHLLALLDEIEARYRVDQTRIYLTGLSMGGYGTWDLAMRAPDRFAAIAPILWRRPEIYSLPAGEYAHLGVPRAKDRVVPLQASEQMIDAINACGGNARLTIYPEAGHDAWTQAYAGEALYNLVSVA